MNATLLDDPESTATTAEPWPGTSMHTVKPAYSGQEEIDLMLIKEVVSQNEWTR